MKDRPFGTNTAMYRDPSTEALTREYRQQKSDYTLARRMLRKQARAGQASVEDLTGIAANAAAQGINMGMESRDQIGATVAGRLAQRQEETRRNNLAAGRLTNPTAIEPMGPPAPEAAPKAAPKAAPEAAAATGPETRLGKLANNALSRSTDQFSDEFQNQFKTGLVKAMGQTNDPKELAELQDAAGKVGVTAEQFNAKKDALDKETAFQRLLRTGRARK
jgi:hypothetical protein